MKKVALLLLLIGILALGTGAACAQGGGVRPAGTLISNNPGDWRLWDQRDGYQFTMRTKFLGDIKNYADPRTEWAWPLLYAPLNVKSLDIYSGHKVLEVRYTDNDEVLFIIKRIPMKDTKGDLIQPELIPTLEESSFSRVGFVRADGVVEVEEFTPAPFAVSRIPTSDSTGSGGSGGGGCSAGAPFAAVLLLPLLAFVRRRG